MSDALPDLKQKLKLLFGTLSKEKLIEWGERYLQAGWVSDSLDFFVEAEHGEGFKQVRELAVKEGDAFILRRCLKEMDVNADEGEWKALGENALKLGKLQFAREGFRLAGERKMLDRVDAMINPPKEEEETDLPMQAQGEA
ncbi:MAG: hypothetical protein JRF33_11205 [Deltaproteobacteria bacterium]|nr:hypothetical protein [Deltaproteobacteria bacterium]